MGLPRLRYPSGSASPTTIDFERGPIDFVCEPAARSHSSLAASGFRAVVKEAVDLLINFTMPAVYLGADYPAWSQFASWASAGGEFTLWPNRALGKQLNCVSEDLSFAPSRKAPGVYEIQLVWRVVPDSLRPVNSGQLMQWYYDIDPSSKKLAILFDLSGSIADDPLFLPAEKVAVIAFISALRSTWKICIYTFNLSGATLVIDYTFNRSSLISAINALTNTVGGSPVNDAIVAAAAAEPAHIVLFTNSADAGSSHTQAQAVAACGVTTAVYTLGFGAADPSALNQITFQTGGVPLMAPTIGDLRALAGTMVGEAQ